MKTVMALRGNGRGLATLENGRISIAVQGVGESTAFLLMRSGNIIEVRLRRDSLGYSGSRELMGDVKGVVVVNGKGVQLRGGAVEATREAEACAAFKKNGGERMEAVPVMMKQKAEDKREQAIRDEQMEAYKLEKQRTLAEQAQREREAWERAERERDIEQRAQWDQAERERDIEQRAEWDRAERERDMAEQAKYEREMARMRADQQQREQELAMMQAQRDQHEQELARMRQEKESHEQGMARMREEQARFERELEEQRKQEKIRIEKDRKEQQQLERRLAEQERREYQQLEQQRLEQVRLEAQIAQLEQLERRQEELRRLAEQSMPQPAPEPIPQPAKEPDCGCGERAERPERKAEPEADCGCGGRPNAPVQDSLMGDSGALAKMMLSMNCEPRTGMEGEDDAYGTGGYKQLQGVHRGYFSNAFPALFNGLSWRVMDLQNGGYYLTTRSGDKDYYALPADHEAFPPAWLPQGTDYAYSRSGAKFWMFYVDSGV